MIGRKAAYRILLACSAWFCSLPGIGQPRLSVVGEIKTLSTDNIQSSRWSIGGETLDRDYANYHAYKTYLNDLGAKRIRLQGGWARCERQHGVYNFAWLDSIVNDALARGIKPWLQLSYGNPIYPGGGQALLAGGIPTSQEALTAWDKWVRATVRHFKDRVVEWEIWNEPDISNKFHAKDFSPFYVRTVALVRQEQPSAKIIALGLADVKKAYYVDSLLMHLKRVNHLDYVDAISFHGYTVRPEDNYDHFTRLRSLVKGYDPDIELWQGENGAPSTRKGEAVGALTKEDWSETTQAKWNLRRMLGDMVYDVDVTNIFQISDMYYAGNDHMAGLNSKGLLKARPDLSIERPKMAYRAYQHTASLFSGTVTRQPDLIVKHRHDGLITSVFKRDGLQESAIVLWFAEAKPVDQYHAKPVSFSISGIQLKKPVLIDLLTGEVYGISKSNYVLEGQTHTFTNIPVGDSPVVVADMSWLSIVKK